MINVVIFVAVCFGFGAIFFGISMRGSTPGYKRKRWIKFWVYLVVVAGVLLCGFLGKLALATLVLLIGMIGITEIAKARSEADAAGRHVPSFAWAIYLPISVLAVIGSYLSDPDRLIFVFIVVAAFDGLSQLSGQLFGTRKLAPVLSPNKTIEGLLGGLVFATVTAVILRDLAGITMLMALIVAPVMGFIGLAGDLSASWIKRTAGIKDYSSLIPGHGGVLDRFDGFLPNVAILAIIAIAEKAMV